MIARRIAMAGLLAVAALLTTGAGTTNWTTVVAATNGGHLIGNPDAKVKLTEYVSYTCPHCAAFSIEGEDALKLAYVVPGKMSYEIRHLVRDPVDLTAAVLANCGAVQKFPGNHTAFMRSQSDWLQTISTATKAQRDRWSSGDQAARRRAIASDFGFYDIMERRGYSRADADRCLNDNALAEKIATISQKDWDIPGIAGTPAFAINGSVLAGTASWKMLQPQLAARF